MRADDGVLIEGVVDVAFREEGVWTVVDYKTDRDLEEAGGAIDVYRRQVALYAEMITRATGEPARAVLMRGLISLPGGAVEACDRIGPGGSR